MSDEYKGSVTIGSITDINGKVAIVGDIVDGDKVTAGGDVTSGNKTIGSETIPPLGFATEENQKQFMSELDNLRKLIVEAKSQIELNASEQAGAEELMQELSKLVKDLQLAKTQVIDLPVGKAVPPEKAKTLDDYLNTAGRLIEKAQQFGEKAAELSMKLAPVALPVLNGLWALLKL